MEKVRLAFDVLGRLVNLRGRRLQRAAAAVRWKLITPELGSGARTAEMLSRGARRARVRQLRREAKRRTPEMNRRQIREALPFRPVYGHAIPATDHKLYIAAMKTKDLDIAAKYMEAKIAAKKASEA